VTARFILYTRSGCHLCDEMMMQLSELLNPDSFSINLIDIDSDPEIQREYALRIPVLTDADSGKIICEQLLDRRSILKHLEIEHPL